MPEVEFPVEIPLLALIFDAKMFFPYSQTVGKVFSYIPQIDI